MRGRFSRQTWIQSIAKPFIFSQQRQLFFMSTEQQDYRLSWIDLEKCMDGGETGKDVINGLSSEVKTLPCYYLYDDRGSRLFEQICDTPEYYPTRTEQAILETYAAEIVQLTGACELVELGSGNSSKTQTLLDAYYQLPSTLNYYPIDISAGILKRTAVELLERYANLRLCYLAGTYEHALAKLPQTPMGKRMLIFLGNTLGNMDDLALDRFLTQIQQALNPGDFFLLGIDLQKSTKLLLPAYNDAQGITAAFNLNILQHLNWRFQGDFNLEQFQHLAFYNSIEHQIEMHLQSMCTQTVYLAALELWVKLEAGETIHTENSRKFSLPIMAATLKKYQLHPISIWTDPQNWFGLMLCQYQPQKIRDSWEGHAAIDRDRDGKKFLVSGYSDHCYEA